MPKFRRKKKLVNSRLQLRMIGVFLLVSGACSLFQVVLLNAALIDLARQFPESSRFLQERMFELTMHNIGWTASVLIPLTFAVGLVLTHRIAGPAYRMREHCKAIARGESMGPCRIRKDDELWDLCDALNEALDALRERGAPSTSGAGVEDVPSLVPGEDAEASETATARNDDAA